jgi:site-specific DNA recombinase
LTKPAATRRGGSVRCAIYTRKSSEEGLEQEFNSLQAQREACEAFIASQRQEGWVCPRTGYDDGGFSGATMERPALQRLLADIAAGRVDTIVVYKIDRLTRSLADFAKIVEILDARDLRWDRGFESRFLQRRVSCEPDFLDEAPRVGASGSATP